MPIPGQIGKGKLNILKGGSVLPFRKSNVATEADDTLQFALQPYDNPEALNPSFNVLYVQTPQIDVLQSPQWQGFLSTWREAGDLMKPVLQFGIPQSSIFDKCPYYK